jgi:hypothetical protein
LACPTPDIPLIENTGEISALSNPHDGLDDCTAGTTLTAEDVRFRMQLARDLAEAIGEAHPDDAVQLMAAALADLTHGGRRPDFFLNAEEEVRWWASFEAPEVLVATLAAVLDNLGNRAMHLDTRKRLFWLLWQGFDAATRAAFLARIGGVQ